MSEKRYDRIKVETGIYKVTAGKEVKYRAFCDYGRQPKLDKETGKNLMKRVKTELTFKTLEEAREARAEAVFIRSVGQNQQQNIRQRWLRGKLRLMKIHLA